MDLFQEGGAAMLFITFFGVVAFVAAILHAALARKWSFILGSVNVPLPLLIGLAGWLYARVRIAEAIAYAGGDPGFLAELEAQGNAEARLPLIFGAIVFFVCLVPFVIGVARQMGRTRQTTTRP